MNKVLFSTTSFDTIDNGPALFANLLHNKLNESTDYELKILSEDLKDKSKIRPKLYKLNLKQTKWNSFFYQFIRMFKYHKSAVAINKEFNYDVLVYNNAFTGIISTLKSKQPVVVMVNDDNKIAYENKSLSFEKTYFKYKTLYYIEKRAARNANTVIVNSKYMKSLLNEVYDVEENKIKILIKGIDLKKYHFKIREKLNNPVHVLFVKADYNRGGLFDLIDALSIIQDYKVKLSVIGPPLNSINSIKEYITQKGLKDYDLNGPLHPEKVKKYFDSADIFCVPSHKEALGVANMEALASGIPVISTNVGGIPEVLDYGKCGWLVNANSPLELSEAIKECIKNSTLRIKKSKLGYKHVQQFNSDNLIDNFLNILKEVKS
ncbi:glycosyltransferase family 4 protein [Aureibaculum sp. 2210JD6-5]|uniref:glycosyltransferase family 4 protein n=1 Tax=Aureibaculum sp. 2210JD6-5 TaxID=3103957 RepID=UPI002AADC379|nr:glycosyltransferase family 4 protein [Aureibaculum sp. 2210JD6-5]MDY7394197.1 glycosyltransferase family 4 protein [Aureibaculum sp. 2210JD6-5]